MTKTENKRKEKMIYTPKCHSPIGEAVITDSGECALRIKRPKSQDIEIVPIGILVTQVAQIANESTQ